MSADNHGKNVSALVGGGVFGAGLVISGMTDPDKVTAFLRLGPTWDPALLFVLGGAVVVATIGFWLIRGRSRPLFDDLFHTPTSTVIDRPLLLGSVLFGIGWGIAGFCPGPAIVGLLTLDPRAAVFMLAFIVGMLKFDGSLANQQPIPVRVDG